LNEEPIDDTTGRSAIKCEAWASRAPFVIIPTFNGETMPLEIHASAPALLIRRSAFDRAQLTRAALDDRLNLTADEFRVEGALIVIGPLPGDDTLTDLIAELEEAGLTYFDDFFELSGNWPEWLRLFAMSPM
jgi:hypothetical protein